MADPGCPLHDPNSSHCLPSPEEVVDSLMLHPVLAQKVYQKLGKLFQPKGEAEPPLPPPRLEDYL